MPQGRKIKPPRAGAPGCKTHGRFRRTPVFTGELEPMNMDGVWFYMRIIQAAQPFCMARKKKNAVPRGGLERLLPLSNDPYEKQTSLFFEALFENREIYGFFKQTLTFP